MSELVYLIIYGGVLLDVAVRARDVSLRLVVVVVGYKVFNGIFREKLAEFRAELRRKYLVVGKDYGRLVHLGNDIRHSEGLAGPRYSEEYLFLFALFQPFHELFYRLGLIACRRILGMKHEVIHSPSLS